jgi:hypothetical protein
MQARLLADPEHGPVDLTHSWLHRTFNNGVFDQGGRFYGPWWQRIPSEYRSRILIDGELTIELDFSGLHPRMLYAEVGLALPDDPYDVGQAARYRDVAKRALNALINAGPYGIAEPTGFDEQAAGMAFCELVDRLKAKHAPIARYFLSGYGVRLQFKDACIAEHLMLHFVDRNVPCLPVHDSFIVQRCHRDELERAMDDACRAVLGISVPINVKQHAPGSLSPIAGNNCNELCGRGGRG